MAKTKIRHVLESKYVLEEEQFRSGLCNHNEEDYVNYELQKIDGIVWCIWECQCGLKVAQFVGEAYKPLKIPKNPKKGDEWWE